MVSYQQWWVTSSGQLPAVVSYQHWNMSRTLSIHKDNSNIAGGQGCNGGNGPEASTAADWSALIRTKCTLLILIHCQYGQEGSNWGEQCDPHARAQASIAAVPAAAHLHGSVTSHWTDLNITCVAEDMGFYFSLFIQETREWHAITCRWRLH